MTNTVDWYERNARAYFEATVHVDMAPIYQPFLRRLPQGSHILDAGCGSGRDARRFKKLGYKVTAFDASPSLAALASEHLGQDVHVMRFDDIDWRDRFDGIWACASLLHVLQAELPYALTGLAGALRGGGVLYCSFKRGRGERFEKERQFTDMDEDALHKMLLSVPKLKLIKLWLTPDRRDSHAPEPWLNALLAR